MPVVSIVLPVYNQTELLLDAICGVFAQEYEDWELIVVDDGSTEDVRAVMRRFKDEKLRFRYYRSEENKRPPHAVNFGMANISGRYFKVLACDEFLQPTALKEQVAYLDAHPDLGGCWTMPRNGPKGNRPLWEQYGLKAHNRSREQWLETLLNLDMVPIGSCTGLFRRDVVEKIGFFREDLGPFGDHEWFCRFFENYQGHIIPHRATIDQAPWANPNAFGRRTDAEAHKVAMEELQKVRELHLPVKALTTNRKVSVWVPVYNLAPYVRETLEGIWKQTHTDWELLIVDDASTDESAKVVQAWADEKADPRIKVKLLEANIGQRAICNMALAEATGDYCMEMSADDVVEPNFMAECLSIFDLNPALEFVATQTDFINADGSPHTEDHVFKRIERASNRTQEEWKQTFWRGNIYFGVGMYRTSGLREIGGWKPEWGVISDYAMYLELVHRHDIFVIERDLTHTRIHGANQSGNVKDKQKLAADYTAIKSRYYPERKRVVFATAFYEGKGYTPYISALLATTKLLNMYGIEWEFMDVSGDSYVQRAKNTIINRFLEMPDATDLFMIDSDMWWNAESVVNMLMLPEEIVVASYRTKNAWERWTSIPAVEEDKETGKKGPRGRALPDGSFLLKGGNLAGGFMRFKRGVLERFKDFHKEARYQDVSADPTFRERVYTEFFACERKDGLFWGEDRVFSRRLAEMNQDWWIYPNVHTGHYGMREHMGNFHEHLSALSREGGEMGPDAQRVGEGLTPSANWSDAEAATAAIKGRAMVEAQH